MRAGLDAEFETVYGPHGDCARFFAGGAGFVSVRLLRSTETSRRYLTKDTWESAGAFHGFREQLEEYERLDRSFERMTGRETRLGAFETCA